MQRIPQLLFTAVALAAVLAPMSAEPAPAPQSEEVVALNERGKELLASGDHEDAIEQFDRAIELDETFWEAWYQRGRAFALLGRFDEATESLLQATVLNPGHANTHMLAAHAALYAGDMDLAWDQGIRSYLAGQDAQTVFGPIGARSERPADFDERVGAWRVHVAGIDTSEIIASSQGPSNARRGATGDREELVEIQADLLRLERHVANALSDATGFGLVPRSDQAQYVVLIALDSVRATPRPSIEGYLRLYGPDSGDALYSRPIELRDLSAAGQVRATLQNVINQMESWRQEQLRERP